MLHHWPKAITISLIMLLLIHLNSRLSPMNKQLLPPMVAGLCTEGILGQRKPTREVYAFKLERICLSKCQHSLEQFQIMVIKTNFGVAYKIQNEIRKQYGSCLKPSPIVNHRESMASDVSYHTTFFLLAFSKG
nr:hypothetical protein [Tanacetum cinerariifolium]